MKNLIAKFSLVAVVIFLASCSKETILKNHLDGESWKVTSATVTWGSTTTDITSQFDGWKMEFKDDGTGVTTDANNDTETFTWEAVDETVVMDKGTDDEMIFTVLDDSRKTQEWENSSTENNVTTTINYKLERL